LFQSIWRMEVAGVCDVTNTVYADVPDLGVYEILLWNITSFKRYDHPQNVTDYEPWRANFIPCKKETEYFEAWQ